MSEPDARSFQSLARRNPPHRIIIAQGENIRTFTVRPWLVATVGIVTGLFATVYLAATGYLFFRDDILAASFARQASMQHSYEDRIASLRANIDRLTSRQLLNQESVEADLKRLVGRQDALDERQDVIAGLSQAMRRAGLDPTTADNAPPPPEPRKDPLQTSSITPVEASVFGFGGLRGSSDAKAAPAASDQRFADVEQSLKQLSVDQVAYVDDIAQRIRGRAAKASAILESLGQQVPTSHLGDETDVGGPFVPLDADADPDTFRANVALLTGEIDRFMSIRRLVNQLPFDRPLADAEITSGYGARMDPFLGRPAMHTGIDFRASLGTPARATAGGTVIAADYTGGYGNMVEIDHGNGVTTRYGHLSAIDVSIGQVVAKGAVIGETGSTGRSTGPHLHYEVRVDGAAIDPIEYLRAGQKLAALM